MTIILIVVRLAPNVERDWIKLQDLLFRKAHLASTRLLEPVIPLGTMFVTSDFCGRWDPGSLIPLLDRIRKTHCLTLAASDTGTLEVGRYNPLDIPVPLSGFSPLLESIHRLALEGNLEFQCEQAPVIRLGWDTPDTLGTDRGRTIETLLNPILPPLPATKAFWLRVLRITSEADPASWWTKAQWTELFSRRCTVYESAPPASSAPS